MNEPRLIAGGQDRCGARGRLDLRLSSAFDDQREVRHREGLSPSMSWHLNSERRETHRILLRWECEHTDRATISVHISRMQVTLRHFGYKESLRCVWV